MAQRKIRTVTYTLYDIVIDNTGYYDFKKEKPYENINEWMNPTEFAALRRSAKWKKRVSCKRLGTISVRLSI